MTPLLQSALFPEAGPAELAGLATELGFDGLDLTAAGRPEEARPIITELAAAGRPVGLLGCPAVTPTEVRPWLELAEATGVGAVRTGPWPAGRPRVGEALAELARLAAATGVRVLVPNHADSCFRDPAVLAQFLLDLEPALVAPLLAPDQLPRWRGEDGWLNDGDLPPLGAVAVANYRWVSDLTAGNTRVWSPRLALAAHGLTPWTAWLVRLREAEFDGLFTFGDPTLPATYGERLYIVRDDLRFVRRQWSPGRPEPSPVPGS